MKLAEAARIDFSALAAGVGVMAHLQARAEPTLRGWFEYRTERPNPSDFAAADRQRAQQPDRNETDRRRFGDRANDILKIGAEDWRGV